MIATSNASRRRIRNALALTAMITLSSFPLAACGVTSEPSPSGPQVRDVTANVYGHGVEGVTGNVYSPRSSWSDRGW